MAALSQTGQFQVGLRSFICRYSDASKHCKCEHVDDLQEMKKHIKSNDLFMASDCKYLQGVAMRIFPNGQTRETFNIVVAISQSASSFSFSLTVRRTKK